MEKFVIVDKYATNGHRYKDKDGNNVTCISDAVLYDEKAEAVTTMREKKWRHCKVEPVRE